MSEETKKKKFRASVGRFTKMENTLYLLKAKRKREHNMHQLTIPDLFKS